MARKSKRRNRTVKKRNDKTAAIRRRTTRNTTKLGQVPRRELPTVEKIVRDTTVAQTTKKPGTARVAEAPPIVGTVPRKNPRITNEFRDKLRIRCKDRPTDNKKRTSGGAGRKEYVPWC